MLADILKYISARLALTYLFFMLAAFGVMYFGEGRMYPVYFLFGLLFFSFIVSSIILSHLGKWRFNSLMVDAQECDITRFFRKGEVLFEKLLILTNSFHFLPNTAYHLKERVYKEYSRFLLALDVKGEKALTVHKKAFEYGWENVELEEKLISIFLKKRTLEKDEIGLGIKLSAGKNNNLDFIDLLVENCLSQKALDYDSQEVFRQAVAKKSKHTGKVLGHVLPGVIQQERSDPFAIELYFTAVETQHPLKISCRKLLRKLATPYLFDKDLGSQEKKLVEFYHSTTPKKTREEDTEPILESGFPLFSLKKKGNTRNPFQPSKNADKKIRKTYRPARAQWKSYLPDTTYLYIVIGTVLVSLLGFQTYRERTTPQIQEQIPARRQVPSENRILKKEAEKYIKFKSGLPYTIQVGAYKTIEKAEDVMRILRQESKVVYWLPATIGQKIWYRVRIGEFKDQEAARLFANELEKKKLVGKDYYLTNFKEGFIRNDSYLENKGS